MTTKDVQVARERFLADDELDRTVRAAISTSWRRSKALSVPADRLDLVFVREPKLDSPLMRAAGPVLQQLADGLAEEPVSVILTSADGVVLNRITASRRLDSALDNVHLAPGYSYAEEYIGTNGIGTAIETRQPTLVVGAEHYADCLGHLACAGVPIIHPISGALAGVLDLTGWVDDGGPLLATLARSATNQIEGRLLAQASAAETELLNTYLSACRRAPQIGTLAVGDEVVLMNRRLRVALDAEDQAALLEHALDATHVPTGTNVICALPSGQTGRLTRIDNFAPELRLDMALFHVHLNDFSVTHLMPALESAPLLPGLAGTSASWRRSCGEISHCVRDRQWVVVAGEPGTGRCEALRVSVAQHRAGSHPRVLAPEDFADVSQLSHELEQVLARENFTLILRDIDTLSDAQLAVVAALLQGHEDNGWVGATLGCARQEAAVGALILPFFSRTISVPALRHRIEDLADLVPHFLRQLSRGSDLTLSPAAMQQLRKYSWPGNVRELRQVLRDVVQRQRSGIADVHQLPPTCRVVSRHALTQIEALERDAIVRSLEENHGNKKAAAAALGFSRATIYRKIKEFGITA
ncbi:sigma-54-dependent Fis family transcriptional regulator [Hoyosella subflava]|uniref:Possible transcriptional regulator n=1 Tax=Hoyosella subflava (strain DSM 45089 / JCM 17490 / NBRC 109087 / DQS3-9A1) TaxID=443218 RepID=F6EQB3_HOYSD|nr:helix-turn-helix domain-containing protein [Hoyosella subflava]AEF40598.1 Possible transcriptional regulator [Hoyosella subflava DQS3-9A1]